jgi:hypothetical protein
VLTRYMSGTLIGFSPDINAAQTVQVGITVQLSRLEFWAYAFSDGGSGDLRLDFRPVRAGDNFSRAKRLSRVANPRFSQLLLGFCAGTHKVYFHRGSVLKMADNWRTEKNYAQPKKHTIDSINGCPSWDRTSDQVINSHLLCH